VLILLPPSEGKAPPRRRGRPVDLGALSSPELTATRQRVLDALLAASSSPDALAVLGVGESLRGEVAQNLRLPTADLSKEEAEELIEAEVVRFPFLRERLDDPAGGLSGGQQQQLAIARALLCRPRLLLLDEPSLGLAPKLVDLVFETLGDLRERGVTILLVEQNAIRAAQFADRTYVLSAGRMVLTGTRDELQDTELLTSSYLGAAGGAVAQ